MWVRGVVESDATCATQFELDTVEALEAGMANSNVEWAASHSRLKSLPQEIYRCRLLQERR
jgi:hypothetical protein